MPVQEIYGFDNALMFSSSNFGMEEYVWKYCFLLFSQSNLGFPCSSVGKESACNAGDAGSIPVLGRSPGEGNGKPLQYLCLENLMDRGAWWAVVHGVIKSWAPLSD